VWPVSRLSISAARAALPETVNEVAVSGQRVVLHRRGKDIAALIPIEDLELLNRIEDEADRKAARRARKERGTVPWETVKARAGVK